MSATELREHRLAARVHMHLDIQRVAIASLGDEKVWGCTSRRGGYGRISVRFGIHCDSC